MAENDSSQKTEDPTPHRLEKALEEGQIAFSGELLGGLTILVGMFFFLLAGKWFFDALKASLRERLLFVDPMISHPESILIALRRDVMQVGAACLGLMLPVVVIALLGGVMQTRFNLSTKPLSLNWGRINPIKGIQRIFSTRSLNRGLIALAKAAAIVVSAWVLTKARFGQIASAGQRTLEETTNVGSELILAVGFMAAVLMVVAGVIDYAFQLWKQRDDLRMSLQEIKDEAKETEGDPMIKARIRRLQNDMRQKRMLADVPRASVVITNPTHFAVALRYDATEADAPIVIAKGADFLAQQIIKIAKENGVAVVERKPVARFLYAHVEVGNPIPYELYHVVAEILNFIKRMAA